MAFRQVKELLYWTIDFHEQLATQYRNLADQQQDERMSMTLTFLADREQRMSQSLTSYCQDANHNLLDSWLIDSQDFAHPHVLSRIPECLGCESVQDVLANALTAHQTLKDMFRLRAELAQLPEERDLFDSLANEQETEARLQARDIARLEIY